MDNTDDLVADMDRNGVDFALVQARAGFVSNDLVAAAAKRHPERMVALARVGHDQEAMAVIQTAFGYGYFQEIPAIYVLKYLGSAISYQP